MDIQEVVLSKTGSLQETSSDQSLTDLLSFPADASELLASSRAAESLPSDAAAARQIVAPLVARFATIDLVSHYVGSSAEIATHAMQYMEDPSHKSELEETIRRASNRLELSLLLSRDEHKIYFLDYMWGDNFEEQLISFTSAGKQTVRQWIAGGQMAGYNSELLFGAVTVLYQLHRHCGMSKSEAASYFEEKMIKNPSDLRIAAKTLWTWIRQARFCHKQMNFRGPIEHHMQEIGADMEVFDHDFRRRFKQ